MMKLWTVWVRTCLFDCINRELESIFVTLFQFFCSLHVIVGPLEKGQVRNEALRELRVELSKKHIAGELDGFTLYL